MSKTNPTDMVDNEEANAAKETGGALSLMSGVTPEGLPEAEIFGLDGKTNKRKFLNQGTMLILVVSVVAAGTLYGMRISQREAAPSADTKQAEKKIDQALARLAKPKAVSANDPLMPQNIKQLFDNTEKVVSVFSEDLTQRQVPVNFVKKNPFVLPTFKSVTPNGTSQEDRAAEAARHKLKMQIEKELRTLELQSVMQGARPVAIISGELAQPGQRIGRFKVKKIGNVSVDLEYKDEIFRIVMEEKPQKSGRSRRR